MKTKLTTKDLIAAGAFGAIYLVVLTVLSSVVLPIVPVLFLATPLIAGIVLGTVYMLYAAKVPKKGAILILAVLVGLITSMSTFYPLLFSVIWGILAEVIASRKERRSAGMLAASYLCRIQYDFHGTVFCNYCSKGSVSGELCNLLWRGLCRSIGCPDT